MSLRGARAVRRWNRSDETPWTSGVVASLLASALFVSAFGAMTTVRLARFTDVVQSTPVVRLVPPARLPTPPLVRRPQVPHAVPVTLAPPVPRAVQSPIAEPRREHASGVTSVAPAVRDTTSVRANTSPNPSSSLTTLLPIRVVPSSGSGAAGEGGNGGGNQPVAVSIHEAPIAAAKRDSLLVEKIAGVLPEAWRRPLSRDEKSELRKHREPGISPTGRAARYPGEPFYAPLMNGGSLVGYTLFSMSGSRVPKPADVAADAEYQLRLRRFQDIIALRRDSVGADSLRRDSVARGLRRP